MPNEYPIMNIRAKYADQTPEGKDIDKGFEDIDTALDTLQEAIENIETLPVVYNDSGGSLSYSYNTLPERGVYLVKDNYSRTINFGFLIVSDKHTEGSSYVFAYTAITSRVATASYRGHSNTDFVSPTPYSTLYKHTLVNSTHSVTIDLISSIPIPCTTVSQYNALLNACWCLPNTYSHAGTLQLTHAGAPTSDTYNRFKLNDDGTISVTELHLVADFTDTVSSL